MKTQFNIEEILVGGSLRDELDYERAMIAERKLRVLSKENHRLKPLRKGLRDIIEKYEKKHWSLSNEVNQYKVQESDLAELIAEKERRFFEKRKALIKSKLKRFDLTQQDLMVLLGHKSKTYMSELMNGLSPFTLSDLVVINRLLKIDLSDLVPTTLSQDHRNRIKNSISKLGKEKVKLSSEDFNLVFATN